MLHQECFYGDNDSCKVSFQSIDVNLDFWRLGLLAPPPGPGERLKRPGLIGLKAVEMLGSSTQKSFQYKPGFSSVRNFQHNFANIL